MKKQQLYTYKTTYSGRPISEPKKIKLFSKKFYKYLLIVLPILTLGYFIFYSNFFAVKNIEIDGIAENSIQGELNRCIGKNIFLLNFNELTNTILTKNPDYQDIEFIRGLPDTLKIQTHSRVKSLVIQTTEGNFILDDQGIVFAQVKEIKDWANTDIPIVKDSIGIKIEGGKKIMSSNYISKIIQIKKEFNQKATLEVKEVTLINSLFQINILTTTGINIKMNLLDDLNYQFTNIAAIVKAQKPITSYLDLRVAGIAYYK